MQIIGYGKCPKCGQLTLISEKDGSPSWETHPNSAGMICDQDKDAGFFPTGFQQKEVAHLVVFSGGFKRFIIVRYRFVWAQQSIIGWEEAHYQSTACFVDADQSTITLNMDRNIRDVPQSQPDQLYTVLKWSGIDDSVYDVVEKSDWDPNDRVYRRSRTLLSRIGFFSACTIANNANAHAMPIPR